MRFTARHAAGAGFTYIGMLVTVAIVGVGLALTGEAWRTTAQRERERELLFAGDEIRRAITRYYESTPGTGKQFPKSLEDLLRDSRYPTTRRYLRKVYLDPMTGKRDWGIVKGPGDGIMGVYSLSTQAPLKRANFISPYTAFERAESYAGWRFVHAEAPIAQPGLVPGAAAAAPPLQPAASPIPASAVIGREPPAPPALDTRRTDERAR